jgi:hypothetical protein
MWGYRAGMHPTAVHHSGIDASWVPGAFISLLALLFTIGAFWWLHARQGKLKSWEPHSFAFHGDAALMLLRLPLVLYNTGARPIVVQNLRLSFPDEPSAILSLPWRTERTQLKPESGDGHQLPAVFAVQGRQAEQHFMEFGGPFAGIELAARDYRVLIQARLGHTKDWQDLLSFTLRAAHIVQPSTYTTYGNTAFDITPTMVAQANQALGNLMSKVRERGE